MQDIYLALFMIVTALHLYASLKRNSSFRKTTKELLLPMLLGFYLEGTADRLWPLILALLFGWLGDLLLMGSGNRWFAAGGVAFVLCHVCHIVAFSQAVNWSILPVWAACLCVLAYGTAAFFVIKNLKPHLSGKLFCASAAYMALNAVMNCFACFRFFTCLTMPALSGAVGALLFFVSDAALFSMRFDRESRFETHFFVMLTYTMAQLLLVLGWL